MHQFYFFIYLFLTGLLILLLALVVIFLIYNLLAPLWFKGIFYVPTSRERVEKILKMSSVKSGEKSVDLGSGDGRLVVAMAQAGAQASGYEVNLPLVIYSKINIASKKLAGQAKIYWKSFWKCNFSETDIVTIYGFTHLMVKLEKKLWSELKPGARVVSNGFPFPNWKAAKKDGTVYLYIKDQAGL